MPSLSGYAWLEREMLQPPETDVPKHGTYQRKQHIQRDRSTCDSRNSDARRRADKDSMPCADQGTTVIIDEVQIKHGRDNDEDSGKKANGGWIAPRAGQEIEGSKQRPQNCGKPQFSPAHAFLRGSSRGRPVYDISL